MATFLLSISAHIVFSHAPPLRTVTLLKAESSLPIRLTQRGPLAVHTPPRRLLAEDPREVGLGAEAQGTEATFHQSLSLPAEASSLLLS